MQRDLTKNLLKWKDHPLRKPLVVRGARQVGKTYIVEDFGKNHFQSSFTINFEESPNYANFFKTMDPRQIINSIELISRQKIIPGKTLLFLDEIQECPQALQSLRYFKEKLPELHVIAAGSLLEFAIQDENFSFPVGRIQFIKLYPLSFGEFLEALGENDLRKKLASYNLQHPPEKGIHEHLLERVREYFIIGGMPSSILTFLEMKSFLEVKYEQKAIWDTYENDFGKYAPQSQHRHLRKIFHQLPRLIGDHVKYSKIDPELPNPAREMKRAIEFLQLAGLLHPILATSAGGMPLLSGIKETIFKLFCLDIGLVQQAMGIDPEFPDLMTGSLAEQFVGQELLASSDPFLDTQLFFWARKSGTAEVDYLYPHKKVIYPLEVKAGPWGKLKSLQLFLKEKKANLGIKVSKAPLEKKDKVLSIPFYLVSEASRIIEKAIL